MRNRCYIVLYNITIRSEKIFYKKKLYFLRHSFSSFYICLFYCIVSSISEIRKHKIVEDYNSSMRKIYSFKQRNIIAGK